MPLENKPQSAFDKLDISKIGSGHRFIGGTWNRGIGTGMKKGAGLKGQRRNLQIAGRRGITKNLSTQNIKQIYGLIADRIKNKVASSGILLNRRDRMAIMKESRKMVKQKDSVFTWEDRKDLEKAVDTLRAKSRESLLNRDNDERGISPSLSSPSLPSSPTPPAPSPPLCVNLPPLPSNLNNFGGGMRPKI